MNEVEVVILKDNQWIRLKLTSFKWAITPEGTKYEIVGYEEEEPTEE